MVAPNSEKIVADLQYEAKNRFKSLTIYQSLSLSLKVLKQLAIMEKEML
jgi:hypothetical protein